MLQHTAAAPSTFARHSICRTDIAPGRRVRPQACAGLGAQSGRIARVQCVVRLWFYLCLCVILRKWKGLIARFEGGKRSQSGRFESRSRVRDFT